MDWERTGTQWTNHDFAQFNYNAESEKFGDTTVVTRLDSPGGFQERVLNTSEAWENWFERASFLNLPQNQPGVCVIIFPKSKPLFGQESFASLSDLPVPRSIFCKVVQKLQIQPCITRTIQREVVYFSTQRVVDENSGYTTITSTTRSASLVNHDCALSTVYHAEANLVLAIVFGYSDEQTEGLLKRIKRLDTENIHPYIIPGIFFEFERKRLEECIDELLDKFVLKPSGDDALNLDMSKAEMTDYLKSCYRSQDLQNQINAFKRQLRKIHRETIQYEKSLSSKKIDTSWTEFNTQHHEQVKRAGRRIKSRLEEMCDIMDDKVNECKGTIESTSITMQTLWNHLALEDNRLNLHFSRVSTDLANTNKDVSESMKKDSSQMRSIALLTMVFLPISTVSSIFSTSLFSWDAGPGERIVSRYIWVFIVISFSLTSVVVGSWLVAMHTAKNKAHKVTESDIEDASIRTPRLSARMQCSVVGGRTFSSAISEKLFKHENARVPE